MKKKFLFITYILSVFFSLPTIAQDNVIDEIIWIVGDEAILKSDVENVRMELQLEGEKIEGDPYCVIPERMAIQKLYLHQASLDSIVADESRVVQYVEQWMKFVIDQIGSREKLEEYFKKPLVQIREERKEAVRDQQVVQQVQQKIVGDIKLTPGDVRKFYSQLPQDSLPFIPTTVEVEIITIELRISLEEVDNIKNRLREFTERINSGETEFSTLARLWSEDTESAKHGGELGFTGKARLVPEYATVAFSLNDPTKVSRIVESEYGFHIIQLIEKRGDMVNTRHILLKPKVSEEELQEALVSLDSIAVGIREEKFPFEEAVTYVSYDKDTRNNKGLMVNKSENSMYSGTSRFEMHELPQEIGKIVHNMQPGEISNAFTMINSKQKEVVAIVRLKSRVNGHKANISDDYQFLKTVVENNKREEILNKWITNKQKETYVKINDNWKNCEFERSGWIK